MLLLLLFQVGGSQPKIGIGPEPNFNYRSMCEPIMNHYICNYDSGQCCLPGAICRNQEHFYYSLIRDKQGDRGKFCKCAASAPEESDTDFVTFRNGNFGPPLWAENASKLHIKPYVH